MADTAIPPYSLFSLFKTNDPSRIFAELDKGLRSHKIHEQLEALMFFQRLIDQHPFPVIVNTAFLKLADLFRTGNNFIKYIVHKVLHRSSPHVGRILNVGEVLRRISSVLQSNDPIARAITLRTLGDMALIISDRIDIHHSVRKCFDSGDAVEIASAIYAMDRLCHHSPLFASSMLTIFRNLIESLSTNMQTKLKLIRILRHMTHNAAMVKQTQEICIELLQRYPSTSFVVHLLQTLTLLADKSKLDLQYTIDLLTAYACNDLRVTIRCTALRSLTTLAKHNAFAHDFHLSDLANAVLGDRTNIPHDDIRVAALDVLGAVTAVVPLKVASEQRVIECLVQCLHDDTDDRIPQSAANVLTTLYCTRGVDTADSDPAARIVAVLCAKVGICANAEKPRLVAMTTYLRCIVRLVRIHPRLVALPAETVAALLRRCYVDTTKLSTALLLTRGMLRLARERPSVVRDYSSDTLLPIVENRVLITHTAAPPLYLSVVDILLTAFQTIPLSHRPVELERRLNELLTATVDMATWRWGWFAVGRTAAGCGFHGTASAVFAALADGVDNEQFYSWLMACAKLERAEAALLVSSMSTADRPVLLTEIVANLSEALTAVRAAATAPDTFLFQQFWIELRIAFIEQLLCIRSLTVPGSAADRAAVADVASTLKALARRYVLLRQSFFDIDDVSMRVLDVFAETCSMLANVIVALFNAAITDGLETAMDIDTALATPLSISAAGEKSLVDKLFDKLRKATVTSSTSPTAATDILRSCIEAIQRTPFPIPRYFFRTKSSVTVQVTVSTAASSTSTAGGDQSLSSPASGVAVVDQQTAGLVVKLSGIVNTVAAPAVVRRRGLKGAVCVLHLATDELHSKKSTLSRNSSSAPPSPIALSAPQPIASVSQIRVRTPLQNGAFTASSLIPLPPRQAHYKLTAKISLVDRSGVLWHTGPETSVAIEVK